MKIIQEITFHEMLRRFAIGEVFSEFYDTPTDEHRNKTLLLLKSGEQNNEIEGIKRSLVRRRCILQSFPQEAKWYIANLPVTRDQFSAIKIFPNEKWADYSGESHKLIDAATKLRDAPGKDKRVDAIVSAFKQGNVEMQGITLMCQSEEGPFTIAEGNARLVAVYLCCMDKQAGPDCQDELEIVFGLSSTPWGWD